MPERTQSKRGAYRRDECVFVGVWLPRTWLKSINEIVKEDDSDTSKVLRKAIAEKINRRNAAALHENKAA